MLKSLRIVCFGLLAMLSLSVANVMASDEVLYDTLESSGASYSPILKAQFRIESITLPGLAQFTAARIVSEPAFDSPLRQLGLQPGDVITRLDGLRTDNLAELENHYNWTQVRYIKTGTQNVLISRMFIAKAQPVLPAPAINLP